MLTRCKPARNQVLRLSGCAIGNGWVDPRVQYDVSAFAHGLGLVSAAQARALKAKEARCRALIEGGSYVNAVCWDLLDDVVRQAPALAPAHPPTQAYKAHLQK